MRKITAEQANKLLCKLIRLRNRCRRKKTSELYTEYRELLDYCCKRFDFLVEKKAYKYRQFANYEDLKQDGRMALMAAFLSYNPKKNVDFFWWADKYIKTKITREANCHSVIKIPMKHVKRLTPHKVAQMPMISNDGEPDVSDGIYKTQIKDKVKNAIDKLPEQQRNIILSYFEFGNKPGTLQKICKDLRISRQVCIQLLDEAKVTLKLELSELA